MLLMFLDLLVLSPELRADFAHYERIPSLRGNLTVSGGNLTVSVKMFLELLGLSPELRVDFAHYERIPPVNHTTFAIKS